MLSENSVYLGRRRDDATNPTGGDTGRGGHPAIIRAAFGIEHIDEEDVSQREDAAQP